ncbi:exodeoxyribonuclease V beta subunit [Nocardioides luteus]|uniref:RecBCD enzyme subunit RecB n=1 Tax=Nocardioides luteus TaxID=1844 RepID=A0ABQ5SZK1_9ACTN|nr:UvrD-helicase domain-containing protein [Nocardioides luteus]MDR7312649.1 exodeoxyribonuclease V beta subunit [Nocardioides luteus]GLJ68897.1 RecBCD enzyme subunit RecB [Nocardioides luteus]
MDGFDLTGPLPTGTTLIEASAGTGKTFTIGALVTRYVVEGVARLDEILAITFGRAASQELRDRVRSHLVDAERAFAATVAGQRPTPLDAHLELLLDVPEEEVRVRHERVRDALASFDGATIATTHQFCQLVLRSLGVAGDTDAGAELVDSLDELVVEVVDDLYLKWFGEVRERPPFGRDDALALARTAIEDPQSALAAAPDENPLAAARVRFAEAVREEVARRKQMRGVLSYDDLLCRLADALEDPSAPARSRMRQRWRIVLVDEFQDTDPVQWQVLSRAFDGHATLVLIGDPKQAIYAFRGGDVHTYLTAARTAKTQSTLDINWRSDEPLVKSLQVVLRGAALGSPEIVVHDVQAHHTGSRLVGAPHPAPFRIRRVGRTGFKLTRGKMITAGAARNHIARDLAGDVAELLGSGATWCDEPVRAGDIAVIVAIRSHGLLVQRALQERGIPAVMAGGGDVFLTPAGEDWLALLQALDSPHRAPLVRAAGLSVFFGHTAAELDAGGEALTSRIADTLRGWGLLLRGRGVAALIEAAEERGLTARVLQRTDGERLLTDVRHLGQLLHDISVRDSLGLPALLAWFQDERRRSAATERPRRLDSDAAAVQIVTVHGSKGLQYPVVYLPFAYDFFVRDPEVARFHDDAGQRTIDVTGGGAQWAQHLARHQEEELGEELRDLYVALTRAQSQVVAWWAPTANTATGGLHRLLFGRGPGQAVVPDTVAVPSDEDAASLLTNVSRHGGPVAEEAVPVAATAPRREAPPGALAARPFTRDVDAEWRRTSYSGLIRVDEGVAATTTSEPEVEGKDDEPGLADADLPASELELVETPEVQLSPMAELPKGAGFGSLVHAVLEHTDPEAPDLAEELLTRTREQLRWWPVAASAEELATAILPLNLTPLGPLADGLTLAQIPLRDRLRELDFEIPLAGGDARGPGAPDVRLRDLAPLLRTHLPADDPMVTYADRLEAPPLGDQTLRGYLTGSVDVVLRLPNGRFVVVDYKTNFLGVEAMDYTQPKLAEAMLHSHYPLQALLYSAIVHRFLRWRLPGYDPEQHLGGVLYLYVRGMLGADTPVVDGIPTGVFTWQPPAALAVALSDLLDGVVA